MVFVIPTILAFYEIVIASLKNNMKLLLLSYSVVHAYFIHRA